MGLRAALGAVRREALCAFHRRMVPFGDRGPIVSFAFDDFPRSAYTVGGSILRSFGVNGTYYASAGLMNTRNHLGEQFRAEDLHALLAEGHELASHTFSHISARSVSLAAFQSDVRNGKEAIRRATGLIPSGNFAYPFGEVTLAAKNILSKEMTSCRGVYGGVNGPSLDLGLLRANGLYGGIDRLAWVKALIEKNEKLKGWLIFYTHDVKDNPSPYGCTPELFERALSRALRGGSQLLTVANVVNGLSCSARSAETTCCA